MEKLELIHIAPYLPYDLYIQQGGLYCILKTLSRDNASIAKGNSIITNKLENTVPVLRSLDLIKEPITHNGETFIPIEKINDLHGTCETYYEYRSYNQWILEHWHDQNSSRYATHTHCNPACYPRYITDLLLKWHFDVFGLLEAGVAREFNPEILKEKIAKYYPNFDKEGKCLEKCNARPDGTMIGSVSCRDCKHNIQSTTEWIKCERINEAKKLYKHGEQIQ